MSIYFLSSVKVKAIFNESSFSSWRSGEVLVYSVNSFACELFDQLKVLRIQLMVENIIALENILALT